MNNPEKIEGEAGPPALSSLERNRNAAAALSVVARKLRFSNSRRSKLYRAVGLRPRAIDQVFKWISVALVVCVLVIPNLVTIVYFTAIAADQYNSETRFTVATSSPFTKKDRFGKVTGLPAAEIAQDTQIIESYISSIAMLNELQNKVDFDKIYGSSQADWWARLPSSATTEDKLDYWKWMIHTGVDSKSGIVTVDVRAFDPADAQRVLEAVVASSEKLINDLNNRVWDDVKKSARETVATATAALADARQKLQAAQNRTGVLKVSDTSTAMTALLTQLQGEKIELQNTYDTNAKTVSKNAPQMRVLASQIASKEKQIKELSAQIAGESTTGLSLADKSTELAQLQLNQSLAEQQVTASIGAFEQVQFASQQQLMYLESFVSPTIADSPEYPKRMLWISVVLGASLFVFGFARLALSTLRKRFD